MPLGIHVLTATGDTLRVPIALSSNNEKIVLGAGGTVNCRDDAEGVITASAAGLTRKVPIACRLVHKFGPHTKITLVAGGAPVPFVLESYDRNGKLMTHVRLPLEVGDEGVVELRDGMIYPKRPGIGSVSVHSLGKSGGALYDVAQPIRDRHCSTHLRRTDRSRRLVCEHHRASCSFEPQAVFASDEIFPCATCSRLGCNEHQAICVEDRNPHCLDHMLVVRDGNGESACEKHRSVCHVDGAVFTLKGTSACPGCGRLACATHSRECLACRRTVCIDEYSAAHPRHCATCLRLAPADDPPDHVLNAVVELRGGDASPPKAWKIARDARHVIVQVDLGWSRRLTLSVPHGVDRAERAVATSILGSRVLR